MTDIVIRNGIVLTMDSERRVFQPGFVAIDDGRIAAVGCMEDIPSRGVETTIEAQGQAVLPGLVNSHTHAVHNLMRGGLSDDRVLYDG